MTEQNPSAPNQQQSAPEQYDTLTVGRTEHLDSFDMAVKAPAYIIIGQGMGLTGGVILSTVICSAIKRIIRPSLEESVQVLETGKLLPETKESSVQQMSNVQSAKETLEERFTGLYRSESFAAFQPTGMLAGAGFAIYALTQPEMRPYSLAWLATNMLDGLIELSLYMGSKINKNDISMSA